MSTIYCETFTELCEKIEQEILKEKPMLNDKTPLSFHDAARRGITRLKPVSDLYGHVDHIEIDLIHGAVGPWVRVYTQTIVSEHFDESEELLIDMLPSKESYFDDKCFVPYGG